MKTNDITIIDGLIKRQPGRETWGHVVRESSPKLGKIIREMMTFWLAGSQSVTHSPSFDQFGLWQRKQIILAIALELSLPRAVSPHLDYPYTLPHMAVVC